MACESIVRLGAVVSYLAVHGIRMARARLVDGPDKHPRSWIRHVPVSGRPGGGGGTCTPERSVGSLERDTRRVRAFGLSWQARLFEPANWGSVDHRYRLSRGSCTANGPDCYSPKIRQGFWIPGTARWSKDFRSRARSSWACAPARDQLAPRGRVRSSSFWARPG